MAIFIAALAIFLIAFTALSIGRIFGKTEIKGHCGNPSLDGGCCETDPQPLEIFRGNIPGERCRVDAFGNKIEACASCTCDDQ